MRKLILIVVAIVPSLALAKKPRPDPRITWVDDEPVSKTATERPARSDPNAVGMLREASMRAPEVGKVAVTAETAARVPTATLPAQRDEGAASGEAVQELVVRQMRRNQASIDACTADVVRRHPGVTGAVLLAVVVTDKKVQSIHVSSDTVRDIEFDACLVKAGQAWKLQLASARFTWPVTLSPSASR